MCTYRKAFLTALVVNVALAAGLGYLAWRMYLSRRASAPMPSAAQGNQPTASTESGGAAAAVASAETKLAPIQLSPQRLQSIGTRTGTVELKEVQDDVRATGDVEVDEERLAYVQVRFPGWIQKVYADAAYRYVRRGQPLFTIYSPDLVTTEKEYLLARQNTSELAGSSIPGVATGAASLLSGAVERLKHWDIPQREIDQLEDSGKVRQEIEVDSPATGYITERNALPNLYVQPETRLYTIADLSTVWVYAQVFETDLGKIHAGEPASVSVDAYPGRTFAGPVEQSCLS
jgi:Cu(I)/Ag(I) efflux system membrane fusion protein/cobalt-zinc-cadmium efflux system membrane fusion protein